MNVDRPSEFYIKDEAIQNSFEDRLGRGPFVAALTRALLRPHGDSSLAIGLYGEWGEGKSSVLNLLRENLKSADPGGQLVFVDFDVWRYAGSSQLLVEFFNAIVNALDDSKRATPRAKLWQRVSSIDLDSIKLSELIALYGASLYAAAHPAAIVAASSAIVSTPVGGIIVGTGIVWHIVQKYSRELREHPVPIDVLKRKINDRLRAEKRRLIILVDDIDRLTEPEIREVFRGVRELVDFANTTHLLAFDQSVVVSALNESQKGRGLQYLQKIVQVDCPLPAVDRAHLNGALRDSLSSIFLKRLPPQHSDRLDQALDVLRPFIKTIRDVIRLSNAVKFASVVAGLEVDPLDLVVFTAIEIYAPQFVRLIAFRGELFTDSFFTLDSEEERLRADLEGELNRVGAEIADYSLATAARAATLFLFPPAAERLGQAVRYNAATALKSLRISSYLRLPAYLQLANPPGSIPQARFRGILTDSRTRDQAVSNLEALSLEDVIRFVMQLARHIDQLPSENAAPVFYALLRIGDWLVESLFPMRGYGLAFDLRNVLLNLMQVDWSGCGATLNEYVRNGALPQFTAIDLVNALEDLALHPRRGTETSFPEVPAAFVQDLIPSIVSVLASMAANHRLFSEDSHYNSGRRGTTAVALWRSWDRKSLEAYLPEALRDPEDALRFMRQLVTKGNDRQTSHDVAAFVEALGRERVLKLLDTMEPYNDAVVAVIKKIVADTIDAS